MKFTFLKKLLIIIAPLVFLQGCVTKSDLKGPIKDYISEKYGIDDFKILSFENNAFEGGNYQVYVEIKKPYQTVSYVSVTRDPREVDGEQGIYIFDDIMKGAYIAQFPKVISFTDSLIEKYQLLDYDPNIDDETAQKFHYYLSMSVDEQQKNELIKSFKKEQAIDMKSIIPTLKPGEYYSSEDNFGIVNFVYYYNTYNKSGDVPKAQALVEEFKKSGLLTEGLYQVGIQMIEVTDDDSITWQLDDQHTSVRFQVDDSGEFTIIKSNANQLLNE